MKLLYIRIALITTIVLLLVAITPFVMGRLKGLGEGDFLAYWSAASLLRHGINPYNPNNIFVIQQSISTVKLNYPIMVWNPPYTLLFVLPFTFLTFVQAKIGWLLFNLFILVVVCLGLSKIFFRGQVIPFIILCLFTAFFPPVLSAIIMGQVTLLVVAGLTFSIYLIHERRWTFIGIPLLLTLIKPQITILCLMVIIIYLVKNNRLGLLSFILVLSLASLIVWGYLPTWVSDYIKVAGIAPYKWATPTVGGILSFYNITEAFRFSLFPIMLGVFIYFLSSGPRDLVKIIPALVLITIPFTFYGWSYDQSLLLIPIAQMFAWVSEINNKNEKRSLIILIFILSALNILQRIFFHTNDVFYMWVPLGWGIVYWIVWQKWRTKNPQVFA